MKVYNRTRYDDKLIYNIMKDAKVTAKGTITALYIMIDDSLECGGKCLPLSNNECIIKLKRDDCIGIPILAHELRHVSQVSHGMIDWMNESKRTDRYSERWHEIDAKEFERRYR